MKRLIALMTSVAFAAGCASIHSDFKAEFKGGERLPIRISARDVDEYADPYNRVISLTFENQSGRWIHVDESELDFTNPEQVDHNIILGNDLVAWAESYSIQKRKSEYNDNLGVATAILGGTLLLVAAASGKANSSLGVAGATAALSAAAIDDVKAISAEKRNVETAGLVPEGHLYKPFSIPPGGFARRWFLVNVPGQKIAKTFALNLKTVELGDGQFSVRIRE